jgi:hypothetical protein
MLRIVSLGLLALLLAGCTQTIEPVASETTPVEAEPQEQAPTESDDSAQPIACSENLLAKMSGTIESQIEAFGEKDFELAYSFASPFFRSTVSVEQFVQIINGSYGPLIGSSRLVFSECFSDSKETYGVIVAKFIEPDNDVYDLQYVMVNTDDGWRVQGASNLRYLGEGA